MSLVIDFHDRDWHTHDRDILHHDRDIDHDDLYAFAFFQCFSITIVRVSIHLALY